MTRRVRRLTRMTVVAVGAALVVSASAPAAAARSSAATSVAMTNVIVVLEAQADLTSIRASSRRDRLTKVVRALQATATQHQQSVLTLLRARRTQHLVSAITPLWVANEIAVTATAAVVSELVARTDVREVRPEVTIRAPASASATASAPAKAATALASAESGVDQIDAPPVWELGFQGQGVVVASLDTGVDASHPDLAGRWRGGTDSWFDPNGEHPTTPTDIDGHGTQTMGVILGGDAGGTTIGVAPGARWIAAKIFDDRGLATTTGIHQAFQWVLDPDHDPATPDAPNVVNNSWDDQITACSAEFQPDLAGLRAAGILPVFAAGNNGPSAGSVLSPANLAEAVSAGGVDGTGTVDPSSGRGPSACGQPVAPTVSAPDTAVRTSDLYGGYITLSGTSLAAPHVTGALALILSAAPDLTADQQQATLTGSAADLGPTGPDPDYGFGRIDVLAAYHALAASPGFTLGVSPASFTTSPAGAATYTVTVAATNGFTGDTTLSLSGLGAGEGTWAFTPSVVTGGAGSAQLVVTTTSAIAVGTHPLSVTGTSGSTSHSVSAALVVASPPDFSVTAAPSAATVNGGAATQSVISVGASNGFADVVDLSVSSLPAGVGSAVLTPAGLTAPGSSHLDVTTLAGAPPGSYPLTVTATSGAISHTTSFTLTVSQSVPRDFAISASPTVQTVARGKAASYTIATTAIGGFTGRVRLTLANVPRGATTNWTTKAAAVPGAVTLKVRTTRSLAPGTYQIVVTATCGALTHQVTVTLVVT